MIRKLENTDIKGLNVLPPRDWSFDIEQFIRVYNREVYFKAYVLLVGENIVGLGNVFLKGKIGWLANIIVSKEYRGRGLGSEMTKFLVNVLNNEGCETQLLIATQLGESVYKKVGFRKVTDYLCFDSEYSFNIEKSDNVHALRSIHLGDIYKLDREANGEDRSHFIDKYYRTGLGYFDDSGELQGFYLPDFSRGLILARDKKAGLELLKIKHSQKGRRSMMPAENIEGAEFLRRAGLKEGVKLSRMILGTDNNWNPYYIFSYGGGYCG